MAVRVNQEAAKDSDLLYMVQSFHTPTFTFFQETLSKTAWWGKSVLALDNSYLTPSNHLLLKHNLVKFPPWLFSQTPEIVHPEGLHKMVETYEEQQAREMI